MNLNVTRQFPLTATAQVPFPITFERVKVQSRKPHISRLGGSAQATQYQTQPFSVLCLDAGLGAGLEELGQTLVFEPADHPR